MVDPEFPIVIATFRKTKEMKESGGERRGVSREGYAPLSGSATALLNSPCVNSGRSPKGSQFFCFAIQILQNVAASEVGAPSPTGNPGSATDKCSMYLHNVVAVS